MIIRKHVAENIDPNPKYNSNILNESVSKGNIFTKPSTWCQISTVNAREVNVPIHV